MSPKLRLIICNDFADEKTHPAGQLSIAQPPAETEVEVEAEDEQAETEELKPRGNRLLPALTGLFLALFFQFMVHKVYGVTGVTNESWIDAVTWLLFATGVIVSFMQFVGDCFVCRIYQAIQFHEHSSQACKGCS
jgi:uncharacterized membrane protein (DUF485 family)